MHLKNKFTEFWENSSHHRNMKHSDHLKIYFNFSSLSLIFAMFEFCLIEWLNYYDKKTQSYYNSSYWIIYLFLFNISLCFNLKSINLYSEFYFKKLWNYYNIHWPETISSAAIILCQLIQDYHLLFYL